MTYHLSEKDKKWLSPSLSTLLTKNESVLIKASDPKRLLYLLRQAGHSQEYTWLREKFILKIQPDGVLCKIRRPEVNFPEKGKEDQRGVEIKEENDLLSIVNYLVQHSPRLITWAIPLLSDDDLLRLQTYCEVNNYEIKKNDDNSITIKKT